MNLIWSLFLLSAPIRPQLDLDLQTTPKEYQKLIQKLLPPILERGDEDPFLKILHLGSRNLQWRQKIIGDLLQVGPSKTFTPNNPLVWGPEETLKDFYRLMDEMPKEMGAILEQNGKIPSETPIPLEQFLPLSFRLDDIYSTASRWVLHRDYLDYYAQNSKRDIRGYYNLSREEGIESTLLNWPNLSEAQHSYYSENLIGLCMNSAVKESECRDELNRMIETTESPLFFYQRHLPQGEEAYESFFKIKNPRKNVRWNSDRPEEATISFLQPKDSGVKDWLKENIEDEWKINDWGLKILFKKWGFFETLPQLRFVPGATAHVDKIGGNIITMDANEDYRSAENSWTIRHEFGHVLGFPDCYLEFYLEAENHFVGYHIDPQDLMCARGGRLLNRHYQQLFELYFKK